MKKILSVISVCFAVCCSLFFTSCSYNSFVDLREEVVNQWANVETQYQRRYDLVPNLVATVKGVAKHEEEVFSNIAEARSKLGTSVNIDDAESFKAYQKAQNELGSSLSRLLVITENYPELKSNANFLDLQSQLEGVENRIATARTRYNDSVKSYNTAISRFPGVITAKMFHFSPKEYFKADEASAKAPVVSF